VAKAPHREKACKVMAAASKYREKYKKPEKPVLVGDPEESTQPLVQIREFLCRFLLDLDSQLLSRGKSLSWNPWHGERSKRKGLQRN
jgi:hypothetical protein